MMTKTRRYKIAYWLLVPIACVGIACAGMTEARAASAEAAATRPVILFLGTSLTAGYGLPSNEAFPALIQRRIDEAGLGYRVVNAGVSGDTSAGGLRRISWLLRAPVDVLVLELGANDMLRGLDLTVMRSNLQQILDRTRAAYPEVRFLIVGIRAAPNLGEAYGKEFEAVYPALAKANGLTLLPDLLEGVAGNPTLNQADGLHPTAAGQGVVAQHVWKSLEKLLVP